MSDRLCPMCAVALAAVLLLSPSCAPPTIAPTSTPMLTDTPIGTVTPTPKDTATPSPTPGPEWPNDFQLGAVVSDVEEYAELMRESGMTWATYYYDEEAVPILGAQRDIRTAHDLGLRALLVFDGDKERIYDTAYQSLFVSGVRAIAVKEPDAIQVLTHPNSEDYVGKVDPEEYADLLCHVYDAVKVVSPDTLVISGSPAAGMLYDGCTIEGCDDLEWLRRLEAAGAGACLDMIGAHHWWGATSPDAVSGHPSEIDDHSYYFWWQVEEYSEVFDGKYPLAFTGFGYCSPEGYGDSIAEDCWWAERVTAFDQAAWTMQAVEMSMESDEVDMIIIGFLDTYGWEVDGWALIRPDGSCPACDELAWLFAGL